MVFMIKDLVTFQAIVHLKAYVIKPVMQPVWKYFEYAIFSLIDLDFYLKNSFLSI